MEQKKPGTGWRGPIDKIHRTGRPKGSGLKKQYATMFKAAFSEKDYKRCVNLFKAECLKGSRWALTLLFEKTLPKEMETPEAQTTIMEMLIKNEQSTPPPTE